MIDSNLKGVNMKEKLRIIYFDEDDKYSPYKIADVIDFDDRFVTFNEAYDYYGGFHIKKRDLTYVIATPEKESMIADYIQKRSDLDLFRLNMIRNVFDV
jgi:hypothetical protein